MNCREWFENDSVSSKEAEFEKILSFKVNILEILVGKRRGNKKFELRVSIKLFIEPEISYSNKSILKSPRRKILLDDSFCKLSDKEEIKYFLKILF